MLNRFDDYPIHQTSDPIAHTASGDRNAYDRYWFNGYSRSGDLFFAAAFGVYPNRRVVDGAFSVVRDGRQYVVRASRLAPVERSETTAGPIRVEIVEPMNRVRLRVDENDFGLSADLVFSARTVAIEEPKMFRRSGSRTVMDATRFTQFGVWDGFITIDGQRIEIGGADVLATRDRSWGVRQVGEAEGGAPSTDPAQFYWLWAPIHFDDVCTLFQSAEDAGGTPWHAGARIVGTCEPGTPPHPAETPPPEHMHSLAHSILWEPATRRARSASLSMADRSGARYEIELQTRLLFPMRGIGYLEPGRGHGVYQGELEISGDRWTIAELDPGVFENLHVQQLCTATMGDRTGVGVLEQLCIGPHTPSGFGDLLDLAK